MSVRHFPTLAFAALLAATAAQGGSIWTKGGARTQLVATDDVARHVGDSLTIVISEKSVINSKTKRDAEKKTTRDYQMNGTFSYGDIFRGLPNKTYTIPTVDVSGSSDNKFEGNSDYDSNRSVEDRITVTIEDVLPNGNLVVLGQRERNVAGDMQIIQVSGIVRPSDITFNNTINSELVADFRVVFKNKGQGNTFVEPGWFGRFLNYISPS
jgi:flagellar L-ring protein precursor FlgH